MHSLTILICTHNRVSLLQEVITSINHAARPDGWLIDILVVANACSDGTADYLREYEARQSAGTELPLTWFEEPTPGKSHALNSALSRLTSEVVFLEDDDQTVAENFLVSVCAAAEANPEASMICGRLLPNWRGDEPAWIREDGPYRIYPNPIPDFDPGREARYLSDKDLLPSGGNLILRLPLVRRVGQFSTELGPRGHNLAGGEDTAYIRKALAFGEKLLYDPSILQFHYVDPDRLKFDYLAKLAYKRTYAVVRMGPRMREFPLYALRKLLTHAGSALVALNADRRRFFAIRTAATVGEIAGFLERRFGTAPESAKRIMRPDGTFGRALGAVAAGVVGLSLIDGENLAWGAGPVSATVALALLVQSLLHFSRTGPQLKSEIRNHYLQYSAYAVARLGIWASLVGMALSFVGLTVSTSLVSIFDWPMPSVLDAVGISLVSILGLSTLQFIRQLHRMPASLEASFNYRMSRFYPVWRYLNSRLIDLVDKSLLTILYGTGGLAILAACGRQHWSFAVGLLAMNVSCLLFIRIAHEEPEPAPIRASRKPERPNILMLGSDGMRFDCIGAASGRNLTPTLDALAKTGMLLEQCFVPCARTAPSLASLLTGRWPHEHRIRDNFTTVGEVDLGSAPLPRFLHEHGYRTLAISDWCGSDLGKFDFGFEETDLPEDQWNIKFLVRQGPKDIRLFLSLFTHSAFGRRFIPELYFLAGIPMTDSLGRRARKALSEVAALDEPFFINVFMSSTHAPFGSEYPYYRKFADPAYRGDSKFVMSGLAEPFEVIHRQGQSKAAFDIEQIRSLYDGCVNAFDNEVAKILQHLAACGLAESTVVAIYTDHGMEFFERETWGQGNSVIVDESAHVPAILIDPRDKTARRIPDVCRSIDIAPTLLEMLNLPQPSAMRGHSVLNVDGSAGQEEDAIAYSETGIWVTRVPSLESEHIMYPDLPELLEIPDKQEGTIAIKPEYQKIVIDAKDRMLRSRHWKLVHQPMVDGVRYSLFDLKEDPGCMHDVSSQHPDVLSRYRTILQNIVTADLDARAFIPPPAMPAGT